MPNKNQSCSNCYFWFQTGRNDENEIGYCRANPPTPSLGDNGRPTVGKFPIVLGSMWCGAWDVQDTPK